MSIIFGTFNRSLLLLWIILWNFHVLSARTFQSSSKILPKCKYDEDIIEGNKLFQSLSRAEFIFTGRVVSGIKNFNDSIIFDVFVQRCFKNSVNLRNNSHVSVLKHLTKEEGLTCRQIVRKKYTAIFVAVADKHFLADVELLITPLPVTLTNLDRVSIATKGQKCSHNETKRATHDKNRKRQLFSLFHPFSLIRKEKSSKEAVEK
ncbi:hypothetical protein HHI36_022790 [Cryptolaemus montrouzieri]|uniref:Uncharacterized protein n=1 Tax=Cryptolaemus montrouzieri TaxID=559131 RepID=A0ABD2PED3_9CUCU